MLHQTKLRHEREHEESAAPLGWLLAVHVSASERDAPRRPTGRGGPRGGVVQPARQRREMGGASSKTSAGDSIVILGPGQQGLGCVLASSITGANPIIVAGLERDAKRLAVAKDLGATHTIVSERAPLPEQVKEILGPEMADVVVDVTGSTAAQQVVVELARRGGTVVLAGRTPNKTVLFVMDKLAARGITLVGVRAHESEDIRKAISIITARREQLSQLLTHELPLFKADLALRLIGQEIPGEEAIHVALNPWSA